MIDVKNRTMDYADYLGVLETLRLEEHDLKVNYESFQTVLSTATGPHCPVCGFVEKGWLRADLPVAHPYFGFLVRCPKCADAASRGKHLVEFSRLSGALLSMTFGTFRVLPGNRDAVIACKGIANGTHRGWVTIWGGYGCGKTHLLAATVNYAIGNGVPAAYYRMADLVAHLREGIDGGDVEERLRRISLIDTLAIDDADPDMINMTPFSNELMTRLVEMRYQHHERGTVFAAHSPPQPDTDGFYGFLASRMLDNRYLVVHITTGDVRPKMSNGEG